MLGHHAWLNQDNVFLVQEADKSLDWLEAYYESKGYRISIAEKNRIDGGLAIYSLENK